VIGMLQCLFLAGAALAEGYPVFDIEKKALTLNSGYEMPILGLGMFTFRTVRRRTPPTGR